MHKDITKFFAWYFQLFTVGHKKQDITHTIDTPYVKVS